MNYESLNHVVRMDMLVQESVDAFATLVYRDEAEGRTAYGIHFEDSIPKNFVSRFSAVGGKIVASERISAMRKDVTAGLYGGDVTRKRKLLEKQKKGKAKMAALGKGKVSIPTEAYLKVLKRE